MLSNRQRQSVMCFTLCDLQMDTDDKVLMGEGGEGTCNGQVSYPTRPAVLLCYIIETAFRAGIVQPLYLSHN